MQSIVTFFGVLFITFSLTAQEAYKFTDVIDLDATPVISQGKTGTCWSFSTSSFLESEIIRLTGKEIDISEMYTVRNTYPKKADNYVVAERRNSQMNLILESLYNVTTDFFESDYSNLYASVKKNITQRSLLFYRGV